LTKEKSWVKLNQQNGFTIIKKIMFTSFPVSLFE